MSANFQQLGDILAVRRADPRTEPFFQVHPIEPFFVKNLDNVQGDERRLNVLITRARIARQVFANFTADETNPWHHAVDPVRLGCGARGYGGGGSLGDPAPGHYPINEARRFL